MIVAFIIIYYRNDDDNATDSSTGIVVWESTETVSSSIFSVDGEGQRFDLSVQNAAYIITGVTTQINNSDCITATLFSGGPVFTIL